VKTIILLTLACLTGCSVGVDHAVPAKQPALAVPFPPELQMGQAKPVQVLRIPLGQTFKITLPSNPTTGYHWQLANEPNAAILTAAGHEYQAETPARIGSGGHEIWTFRACGMGRTAFSLQYVRSWETGLPPADISRFEIIVLSGE